ncbi:hypothetical protein B5F33_08920 [Collinsella sp. An2]|nr:hypothetical protein B5F33_08920 [Collinsella sp. An2]
MGRSVCGRAVWRFGGVELAEGRQDVSVRFGDLYEKLRSEQIGLVAGAGGLDRPVSWIHMVESAEIATFLEGGEVAIITGVGLADPSGLLDLVQLVDRYGASAVVVNVGPYIADIGPEVIAYCDANDLPLLKAPWSVHMARIMRIIESEIARSDRAGMELAAALENAIRSPEQPGIYLPYLERNGFSRTWRYCVAVIEPAPLSQEAAETRRTADEALLQAARGFVTFRGWACATLLLDGRLVAVFAEVDDAAAEQRTTELVEHLRTSGRGHALWAGLGGVTKNARCIGSSYVQALRLEQLERAADRTDTLPVYARLGVFKVLLAVDDQRVLREYVEGTIGRLVAYDAANDTDLLLTLKLYLELNGRVKDVAERLFVHRNTVNYKVAKAAEILGADLSSGRVREELLLAIQAKPLVDAS